MTEPVTDVTSATDPVTEAPDITDDPNNADFYIISAEDYRDKTTAGFLSQMIGFLSDYKYVWNSDMTPKICMPDTWWRGICTGNDAPDNPYHSKIVKLFYNNETKLWETWIADAFSIDVLGQHIMRDMYAAYDTTVTKVITEGWVKYAPWDMGGGNRTAGAYNLAVKKGYISPYLGNAEYGNRYPWCQEPWIGNDGMAMAAAGMPDLALDLTSIFGRVTGDSDNVEWLDFVVAMSSMAYFESDIPTLIKTAASLFAEDSWERYVVQHCFDLHAKYPESWRQAMIHAEKDCARPFYYLNNGRSTNEQGRVEVNMAFMILALLYGEGDYLETAKMLSLCGYDTRGTIMLPILAIIGGMDAMPKEALDLTWQDGKGEIVNKAIPDTVTGVWMFAEGLPERYKISDVIDLYCKNFEKTLILQGGKIEDGKYYIPKNVLHTYEYVSIPNRELNSLDGFAVEGKVSLTDNAYHGASAAEITDGSIKVKVTGLEKGARYMLSAYILAERGTAELFAGDKKARVYKQNEYVLRSLYFTADGTSAEIGVRGTGGTVLADELELIRIEEQRVDGVGDIAVSVIDKTMQKISAEGKTEREVFLKLGFANTSEEIIDAKIFVNGDSFGAVPFYKTGAKGSADGEDTVYIPVLLEKEKVSIIIEANTEKLRILNAEFVTVNKRPAEAKAVGIAPYAAPEKQPQGTGVVYVSGGGNGDGKSAEAPLASLADACAKLPAGGTVVICGKLPVNTEVIPAFENTITFTSVYGGVDYRQKGAKLSFVGSDALAISLGGDSVFKDIDLEIAAKGARTVTCNGNKVIMDTGIKCTRAAASYQWLGITVGSFDNTLCQCDDTRAGELTVNSGSWQLVRGGNRGTRVTSVGDIKITVNGGEICGGIVGASAGYVDGSVYIEINGGTVGTAATRTTVTPGTNSENTEISDNVYLTVTGGKLVNCELSVSRAHGLGGVRGEAFVKVTGGEFKNGSKVITGKFTGKINADIADAYKSVCNLD
ncbi:MAG: ADP-ribosylglycohydrolase family protein [Clostridia bacterium]|nr:ADP-ribosylglycohydrolase family protein [Clostridia bacterium]